MRKTSYQFRLGLLVILSASITGCCANLQHAPDQCADAFYECDLGCIIHNLCSCGEAFPCGAPVECGDFVEQPCLEKPCLEEPHYEEAIVPESCESACLPTCDSLKECVLGYRERVAVGPPPVPYQPPMPPKFLTVPTHPVYTAVSPHAPTFDRCQVEVNFNHQLTFPGRD